MNEVVVPGRVWTFGKVEEAVAGACGYETFDYGNQIALWIKPSKDAAPVFVRLSREQAAEFGRALVSVLEPR